MLGDVGRVVGIDGLSSDGRLAGRLIAGELMEGRLVFGRAAGREPPRLGPLGRLAGRAFGADEGWAAGLPPPRLGNPSFNPASASRANDNKAAATQQLILICAIIELLQS